VTGSRRTAVSVILEATRVFPLPIPGDPKSCVDVPLPEGVDPPGVEEVPEAVELVT